MTSDYHPTFLWPLLFISVLAIFSNILMIVAVLRSHAIRTAEYFFNINVVLSDLVFAAMVLVVAIVSLGNGSSATDDTTACQAIGYILQACGSSSVLTIAFLTYNHYRVIVREKSRITYTRVAIYLVGIWAVSLLSSTLLFSAHSEFEPRPAHIHCHFDYSSRNFLPRFLTGYLIVHLVGLPISVGLAYGSIYNKVCAVERIAVKGISFDPPSYPLKEHDTISPPSEGVVGVKPVQGINFVESVDSRGWFVRPNELTHDQSISISSCTDLEPSSPNSFSGRTDHNASISNVPFYPRSHPQPSSGLTEALRNVANRGLMISMSFSLFWLPTLVVCIWELSTGTHVSWEVDAWATTIAALNTLGNPIVFFAVDRRLGSTVTPFARALLRVCGQVFASATIPRAWLCASIVSIDKKDGDPLNPGDKRGIALINVGLKLVCKVLQMRIERFVETNNLLSYEQAGFRKREEHSIQSPVGALLWKLQNMGFPRRTLAFLKALYTSSSARARAGSLLSDPFPVQRGVRQGCPLSGLLFNLFINDILDGVAPITVPGLPRDTNPIRGLMYADDVAVFADSEQSLLAASTAIEQWANRWEMQFGVAKCGIISFTGHLAPRLDNPLDIRLHGQLVSRVESYKYLGVLIDSKLDHSAWLKQKRSALEHTISALHPVLANHQLTVNYRSRIFSAVVMGKAYYGLELVGGNKSHLAPLQTTINKGIRLFTGARLSTAIGPLLVETGIGSLLTRSLVSRVRLLERSVTKRTPINAICSGTDNDVFTLNVQGQLVRSQRWFWSRRTKQLYRNRYWLTPQVRPKTVKQRHSFALMETLRTCGDSASLQKYVTRQLLDTSGFFKDPSFDQSRAHGTRYLMLARMDALWTARKAIQIGILVDTHPFSVDHCILCDQQLLSTSIAHLVVECEQVTGHRIQSGLVPAIQKSRLRLLGRALDPGVENVYTWLRGGVLNGEADLDQRWLDGTVEHESMGTRHDNRVLGSTVG
ncbi:hypothetical protein BASA62_009275 [Batrachochytrium salamandrivorans]|nr:hypothetical protein BASA62_009275 [Batrachochytrium salamandrivorans]